MKELELNVTDSRASLSAIRALSIGGVAVLPTDTLYGLHGLATFPGMVGKITGLKGYTEGERGLILLADDLARIEPFTNLKDGDREFIAKHSPGPVSYIVEAKADVQDDLVTLGENGVRRIAFRIPDKGFISELLTMLEVPLLSTSVNLTGEPPLESSGEIVKLFGEKIDLVVSDPALEERMRAEGAAPSGLIDLSCRPPRVLREGKIPFDLALRASMG